MYTWQDFQKCGESDSERITFIEALITSFTISEQFRTAKKAIAYYEHKNPDIALIEKVIYDMSGKAHTDLISPNHKLANAYYPLIIDTGTAHLLANGVAFKNQKTKEQLGMNFDGVLRKIFTDARNCGCSYGFFDGEKLIHIPFCEFAALPDEYTGTIMAGVRFYRIDENKPLTAVLYEPDGYTIYAETDEEPLALKQKKRGYNSETIRNDVQGEYSIEDAQTSVLPIFPLYNLQKQSAICGNIPILAAIDLVNSQLINNISEGDLIYWILQGYGGMDEVDDAQFISHLMKNHIVHTSNDGETITPHQINVQFQANESGVVRLKQMLYDNMRGVMTESLSAGNLTATAITSAYSNQRLNSGLLEYEVIEFIQGIMRIAGISESEKFTFSYYETINASENIQNVIAAAQWLGESVTTRLLAQYVGVIDDLEEIEAEKQREEMERMNLLMTQAAANGEEVPEAQSDESAQDTALQDFGNEVIGMLEKILEGAEDGV